MKTHSSVWGGLVLVASFCFAPAARAQTTSRGLAQPRQIEGRRLALVIGNNAYPRQPLANAVNDAVDMGEHLKGLGFQVQVVRDATLQKMEDGVDEFLDNLQRNDVALFYYSGHGMQIDGENFLLPVDFTAERPSAVKHEAYSAQRVLEEMGDAGAALRIVVLDACRDNPYRSFRSGSHGLGSMAASGALIAFAAAPGRVADDNPGGRNGLFTSELLKYLSSGLELHTVFNRVRAAVSNLTNERQVPWTNTGVVGEFYFSAPAAKAAGAGAGGSLASPTTSEPSSGAPVAARGGGSDPLSRREELAFWESIEDSDDPALFEGYLSRWGEDGTFAIVANRRLVELRASQVAAEPETAPPEQTEETKPPPPAPPASSSAELQAWAERLPLTFTAKHRHTLGGCEGNFSLGAMSVHFRSEDHDWEWGRDQIRIIERVDPTTIQIELYEKEAVLRFRTKKFRFELSETLAYEDFENYLKLGK